MVQEILTTRPTVHLRWPPTLPAGTPTPATLRRPVLTVTVTVLVQYRTSWTSKPSTFLAEKGGPHFCRHTPLHTHFCRHTPTKNGNFMKGACLPDNSTNWSQHRNPHTTCCPHITTFTPSSLPPNFTSVTLPLQSPIHYTYSLPLPSNDSSALHSSLPSLNTAPQLQSHHFNTQATQQSNSNIFTPQPARPSIIFMTLPHPLTPVSSPSLIRRIVL